MQLYVGNDHLLTLEGVQDAVSGDYLNAATVTATLKTRAGVEVEGDNWPITLDYVADSDGNYQGVIEDGVEITAGKTYIVEITVDAGGDLIGFWRFPVVATWRVPASC